MTKSLVLNDSERLKILFSEFPPFGEITAEVREKNKARLITGSVRLNSGMYRTAEEDRAYRAECRKLKLP